MSGSPNTKSLAVRGLIWSYAGNGVQAVLSLGLGILLARILGPGPFGQIAICMVVISIGKLICDFGLGPALIQQKNISPLDIRFVFTWQTMLGALMTCGVALASRFLARLLGQPETAPVLVALSPLFVVTLIGQTAQQLLRRDLRFKATQLIQIVGFCVGTGGVGIPMALAGYGVWCLVVASLLSAVLTTVLSLAYVRHSMVPRFHPDSPNLLRFGGTVFVTNALNSVVTNIDSAVVSRFYGEVGTGLYRRVQTLFSQPGTMIVSSLQQVLFAAGSRLQDDREAIRRSLLLSSAAVAMVLIPIFFTIGSMPGPFIQVVLGTKWVGAIPLVMPAVVAVCLHAMLCIIGPLLWATNRVVVELKLQAMIAGLYILIVPFTSRFSLRAFAWSIAGIYAIRWAMLVQAALRQQWITIREYAVVVTYPVLIGVSAAAAAVAVLQITKLLWPGAPASVLLMTGLLPCAGLYLGVFAFPQALCPPVLHHVLTQARRRLVLTFDGSKDPVQSGVKW